MVNRIKRIAVAPRSLKPKFCPPGCSEPTTRTFSAIGPTGCCVTLVKTSSCAIENGHRVFSHEWMADGSVVGTDGKMPDGYREAKAGECQTVTGCVTISNAGGGIPLNVNVVAQSEVTPGAGWDALFDANAQAITDLLLPALDQIAADLQAICDKLDAGLTVNAIQDGQWTVALEPATIQAILDGFAVALDDAELTLDPASLADLVALLEAATLTVTGDVTVTDGTMTIEGFDQAALDALVAALEAADLTATIDGANLVVNGTVDLSNIPDLVAALEAANLTVDATIANIPELVAALEAATLTVDGTVDIGNLQGILDGLQGILDELAAGIDITDLPAVDITTESISELIAALEAATLTANVTIAGQDQVIDVNVTNEPLTVTLDTSQLPLTVVIDTTAGPVEVTGTFNSDNPLQIDWTGIQDALNGLTTNSTITNFADLIPLLEGASLTIGELPEVVIDPTQWDSLLQALANQVAADYEPVDFCVLDAAGAKVPGVRVFRERKYDHTGVLVEDNVVASQLNGTFDAWVAYTLGAGETIGECPGVAMQAPIAMNAVCVTVDGGTAQYATPVAIMEGGSVTGQVWLDAQGNEITGTVAVANECDCYVDCTNTNPNNQPPVTDPAGMPGGNATDPIPNQVDPEDSAIVDLDVSGAFDDPDGDTLTYSATGLPPGLTIDPNTGVISGTPTTPGTYNPVITATDPSGASVTDTFEWEITDETAGGAPAIRLVKTAATVNGNPIGGNVAVGDTIEYTFAVSNTGGEAITNIDITDAVPGVVVSGGPLASLAVGATDTTTFTAQKVVQAGDVTAGEIQNSATVNGTAASGPVSDTDNETVYLCPYPLAIATTQGNLDTSGSAVPTAMQVGEFVEYTSAAQYNGNPLNLRITLIDNPENIGVDLGGTTTSGFYYPIMLEGTNSDAAVRFRYEWIDPVTSLPVAAPLGLTFKDIDDTGVQEGVEVYTSDLVDYQLSTSPVTRIVVQNNTGSVVDGAPADDYTLFTNTTTSGTPTDERLWASLNFGITDGVDIGLKKRNGNTGYTFEPATFSTGAQSIAQTTPCDGS